MSFQPEEPELSIVEDLDPEPSDSGGWFTPAREALVGILIVAGLVAWAALQWVGTEIERNRSVSYQAGEQAVTAQDWDKAREEFAHASGYRDAEMRADDASQHIKMRDYYYKSTLEHIARKEWVAALNDITEVQKVQPHFSDTIQLEVQASRASYADALPGVVAMRPNAQPPGLYYRVNDDWLWLEGSDAQSRVRGSGVERQVVYDAPYVDLSGDNPGGMEAHERFWLEHFKPATNISIENPRDGRRIIRATLPDGGVGSTVTFTELDYNTRDYDDFNWQSDGVWAFKYSNFNPIGRWPVGQGRNDLQTLAYQKNGSLVPEIITLPSPTEDRMLLDIDLVHARLLEAEWTAPDDVRPIIHLFVSDVDGTNRRLIFTHYGSLPRAQFSPDGAYVLLTTVTFATAGDLDVGRGTVELVRVDLDGVAPPHLVAQRSNVRNARLTGNTAPVNTAIVSKGPYAGRILLSWQNEGENSSTLQVLDPYDSTVRPVEVTVATYDASRSLQWVGVQSSDGLLFTLESYPRDITPGEQVSVTLTLVNFPPGGEPLVGKVVVDGRGSVDLAESHAGSLFFTFTPYGDTDNSSAEIDRVPGSALRQAPDSDRGARQIKPERVYSPTAPQTSSPASAEASFGATFNFGPRALAYSDGKDLYVGTYANTAAIKLESGVAMLYRDIYLENSYVWLH